MAGITPHFSGVYPTWAALAHGLQNHHNLDALHDCLGEEFVVPESGGVVVAFRRFDEFMRGKGATLLPSGHTEAEIVLDILPVPLDTSYSAEDGF